MDAWESPVAGPAAANARRTSREVLREFRRQQILVAARSVLASEGYAEASIDRIAQAAGIARSTLYVYFQGKEELLDQCLAEDRVALGERVRMAVAAASGLEGRLAAFLEALFEHVGERRGFFLGVLAARGLDPFFAGPGQEGVPTELLGIREDGQAVLDGILRRGLAEGEIAGPDLTEARELLGSLLYGALVRRSHQTDPPPARAQAAALAHTFLYGITAT